MEKVCRKCASKTNPRPFQFQQIVQNSQCIQESVLKIRYLERGLSKILKKNQLGFFFCTQSLFMDNTMKTKGLKPVTSLSINWKTSLNKIFLVIYHQGNFDELMQSSFCIISKITFANLCKPIYGVLIITVLSDP